MDSWGVADQILSLVEDADKPKSIFANDEFSMQIADGSIFRVKDQDGKVFRILVTEDK